MKKIIFFVVVSLFLGLPVVVYAFLIENTNIFIPKDKVIDNNYFKAAQLIDISGTMEKDVFVIAGNVTVSGNIKGDLYCLGSNIRIDGIVEGSVRCAGENITISGEVKHNVMVAGSNVTITETGKIGWELLAAAAFLQMNGVVNNNSNLVGSVVNVNGEIKGWLFSQVDAQLNLGEKAKIGGNLVYQSPKKESLVTDVGAQINGNVDFKAISTSQLPFLKRLKVTFWSILWLILKNMLVALAIILVLPKFLRQVSEHISRNFWFDLGIGGAVIVLTIVACLLLLITIIGLPLALIILVLYCLAVYCGKIFVAQTLANWAIKFFKIEKVNPFLALFISLAIIIFINKMIGFFVPVFGVFITLGMAALGVGGIFLVLVEKIKVNR